MRKLILSMGLSLDGLVARPGRYGAGGWGLPPDDPTLKERKLAWLSDRATPDGEGLPLFKGLAAPLRLELVEATTYDSGASLHIYRPSTATP
jgi:hypothetical protein